MSIESWKAEFYPVEAKDVPKEQAVQHSIKKFEGLREENLKRHGVYNSLNYLTDGYEKFYFNGDNCALCEYHNALSDGSCETCTLCKVRDNVACDDIRFDEQGSLWNDRFVSPERMIMWLGLAQWYEDGHIGAVPNDAI